MWFQDGIILTVQSSLSLGVVILPRKVDSISSGWVERQLDFEAFYDSSTGYISPKTSFDRSIEAIYGRSYVSSLESRVAGLSVLDQSLVCSPATRCQ